MSGRCLVVCVALLLGCPPRHDYTLFYAHQPRSIVVVPVLNDSPEVSAPAVFITTVSVPLAERGYYVFPVYLTEALLRDRWEGAARCEARGGLRIAGAAFARRGLVGVLTFW